MYISSDRGRVAVFTKDSGRFGEFFLQMSQITSTPSPAIYFSPSDGIQCVSIGPHRGGVQFAIKRPIKLNDEYRCLESYFRTVKCFDECLAAIVEIKSPLGGGASGFLTSQIYVDDCFGILAFNVAGKLSDGIPLNAEWLRGPVGILANQDYPKCPPF